MADDTSPTRERPIPQVGELYVLRETEVRCVVRIDSVTVALNHVRLRALVLPSHLHAGRCVPEAGEELDLAYQFGLENLSSRLHPLAEYERSLERWH